MAAGDLITDVVWQHEIRAYLFGPDQPFEIDASTGWIGGGVNDHDQNLDLSDGSAAGVDTLSAKVLTFDLYTGAGITDDTDAFEAFADLEAAWVNGGDVQLHALLPHLGHVYVIGRCRGLTPPEVTDATLDGELLTTATFIANDPTIHLVTP